MATRKNPKALFHLTLLDLDKNIKCSLAMNVKPDIGRASNI